MKRPFLTKENILVFLASLVFAYLMTNNVAHIQDIVSFSLPVIAATLLLFIALFLIVLAGITVMRPLIINAAAGLSLILFLGQSYCGPEITRTVSADQALKSLIFFGLAYVIYDFLFKVWKELTTLKDIFKEVDGKWTRESKIMFTLLILFAGLFLLMLYTAISPIVLGLCVYK